MNVLPDVIYNDILFFLSDEDHIPFSMVDRSRASLLLKRVRKIRLPPNKSELYCTSQAFRDQIQSLIVDPYQQLHFRFDRSIPDADGLDDLICAELSGVTLENFPLLMHRLKKVQSLAMTAGFTNYPRSNIFHWINNNPSLSLKSFQLIELTVPFDHSLANVRWGEFPVILNLETFVFRGAQLNGLENQFSNLRCLKIEGNGSIHDVSSFDHIPELHLVGCEGIEDISCLNHNQKIVIDCCWGIIDYSNSFRHSKIIDLTITEEVRLDLSKLLEVRELKIVAEKCSHFVFPEALTLRTVYIAGIKSAFVIPPNNSIRQITIRSCPQFISLMNFHRIHSVQLVRLNLSTLDGLGTGNRIVEITSCPLLRDFRLLRTCDKVLIRNCEGFEDASKLIGVKSFSFSPVEKNLPKNLEGVSRLIFGKIPDIPLTFPSSVRALEIELSSEINTISHLPSIFTRIPPQINEIQVDNVRPVDIEGLRSMVNVLPNFTFTSCKRKSSYVHVVFRRITNN